MTRSAIRHFLVPLVIGFCVASAPNAAEQKLTVDDTEVYYGIVPAEIVKKHPDKDSSSMHGKRTRQNYRHLVVALFDAKSGERVSDASVAATVTPLGLAPARKQLEQMRIDETVTYGNFFEFSPDSSPFRIELKIVRPNRPTHSVSFEYRP